MSLLRSCVQFSDAMAIKMLLLRSSRRRRSGYCRVSNFLSRMSGWIEADSILSFVKIPRSNRSLPRAHPSHCWPRSAPSQDQRVHAGAGKDRPLLRRPGRGSVRRAVVPMFSSAAISIGLPFADYLRTVGGRVDLMLRTECRDRLGSGRHPLSTDYRRRQTGHASWRVAQSPNARRQAPSKPSAKRQAPSAQAPNAKRQTPNAKRQTPNANRQAPNAKCHPGTPYALFHGT
jgi:hypothetical protein